MWLLRTNQSTVLPDLESVFGLLAILYSYWLDWSFDCRERIRVQYCCEVEIVFLLSNSYVGVLVISVRIRILKCPNSSCLNFNKRTMLYSDDPTHLGTRRYRSYGLVYLNYVQVEQLHITVCFWYLLKSDLSSAHNDSNEHWASHFLQGTRKIRPCSSGWVICIKIQCF